MAVIRMPDLAATGGIVGITVGLDITSRVAAGAICCGDTGLGNVDGTGVAAGLQLANSSIISRLPDRKSRFKLGTFTRSLHFILYAQKAE